MLRVADATTSRKNANNNGACYRKGFPCLSPTRFIVKPHWKPRPSIASTFANVAWADSNRSLFYTQRNFVLVQPQCECRRCIYLAIFYMRNELDRECTLTHKVTSRFAKLTIKRWYSKFLDVDHTIYFSLFIAFLFDFLNAYCICCFYYYF